MNIRYTPKQKLQLTRQIHLLREEGQSMSKIAKVLHITRNTITSYLALPYPTEEEIAAAPDELPPHKNTAGGLKYVRTYLPPQLLERLMATSGDQKPNLSDLARQAVEFWCNALERINANDIKPVKLCGVKVRFERKVP